VPTNTRINIIKLINNGRKSISSIDNVLNDGNVHQGRPFTDIVIENQ
jgi:hypothetical protein